MVAKLGVEVDNVDGDLRDIITCATFVFGKSGELFSDADEDDDDLYLGNYIEIIHRCLELKSRIEAYENLISTGKQSEEVSFEVLPGGSNPEVPCLQRGKIEQLISDFDLLTQNPSHLPKLAEVQMLICDQFVRKMALEYSKWVRCVFTPADLEGAERRWRELAAAWELDEREIEEWYFDIVKPALRTREDEIREALATFGYHASAYGLSRESFDGQEALRAIFTLAFLGELPDFRRAWTRIGPFDPNVQHDGVPLVDWAVRGGNELTVAYLEELGAISAGKTALPEPDFTLDW